MFNFVGHTSRASFVPNSSFAALESALVAPLLLCLIFGVIDGSRMVMAQSVVEFTAQQMARWSDAHSVTGRTNLLDYAQNDFNISPDSSSDMAVSVFPGLKGSTIQVRSSFTFWSPKFIRMMVPGATGAKNAVLFASAITKKKLTT